MTEWAKQSGQLDQPLTHDTPRSRASGAIAVLALVAGVVGVLVIAGMGIYFFSTWVGERTSAFGEAGDPGNFGRGGEPEYAGPLVSAEGFEFLRTSFEKETGGTRVIDMAVYPRYAVAEIPEGSAEGRTRSLYFDGSTWAENSLSTTTARPFDIARIDPQVLAKLSRDAREMVDEADSWYVILRAPDAQGSAVFAYASNKYGEGGYIAARVDGKVLGTYTW